MKKNILLFIAALVFSALPLCAEAALPFTDADYLREDFGFEDYREYVDMEIDGKGCKWPKNADVIHSLYFINNYGQEITDFPEIPETVEIVANSCFNERMIPAEGFDFSKYKNLKFVDKYAFYGNPIYKIDLRGTSVVRLATSSFYAHHCFESMFIAPDTLKRIDDRAFANAPFSSITLNDGLEYIGNGVFKGTFNYVLIPKTVKHIGTNGFEIAGKTYRVYKGSYAEEWCKANGAKYVYEDDLIEKTAAFADKGETVTLGPVTITNCMFKYIKETDDYKTYNVTALHGSEIIANYDNMEFLLYPYTMTIWDSEDKYIGGTDRDFFDSSDHYKTTLEDKYITVKNAQKLPNGLWKKGLTWSFKPNPAKICGNYALLIKRDGKEYRYIFTASNELNKYTTFPKNAKQTSSAVSINGKPVEFCAYNIENNNYFKLRDIAMALSGTEKQFNVTWNEKESLIDMISSAPYQAVGGELSAGDGTNKDANISYVQVLKDGYHEIANAYSIEGNNYFKLRDLAGIFNFNVEWDGTNNSILIDTGKNYIN